MADRVASDNPSVTTLRATVERRGGTRRPELRPPADADAAFPDGEVVRLVIDGLEYHAPVDRTMEGEPILRGAFDTAPLARERGGAGRLAEWVDETGIGFGRTVLLDVVVPEFRYGVRLPGTEAVYDASEPPAASLRGIAERLDGS